MGKNPKPVKNNKNLHTRSKVNEIQIYKPNNNFKVRFDKPLINYHSNKFIYFTFILVVNLPEDNKSRKKFFFLQLCNNVIIISQVKLIL